MGREIDTGVSKVGANPGIAVGPLPGKIIFSWGQLPGKAGPNTLMGNVMSASYPCRCPGNRTERMKNWVVTDRKCNYSAFNGYQRTTSNYSQLHCPKCHGWWRTAADYVDSLPDGHGR